VASAKLGLFNDVRQPTMHGASKSRRGFVVHSAGKQRMTEGDSITVDVDDAAAFSIFEQAGGVVGRDVCHGSNGIHGRFSQARRSEEQISDLLVKPVDPFTHQL
jgi:hypothetical protein